MDSPIWFYVLIGIVYAVSRFLKRPDNQPKDVGEQSPGRPVKYNTEPPAERPKAVTFEDLLKEIMEAKQPQSTQPSPMPSRTPQWVDYDDDLKDEKEDLEEVDDRKREQDRQRSYAVYEEAKRQAFERPSLEETLKVTDTNVQYGKFKEFELQKERNLLQEYTINLQDAEGLKKAFVMSEILKRKF